MSGIFFQGWMPLLRLLLVGVLAYAGLIAILRVAGRRTLASMNAFDLVVTVAMGSMLATIILDRDVTLVDGMAALFLLVALQFLITWTSVRWESLRAVVTGEPVLLLYKGRILPDSLRRARVTEQEVAAALRAAGVGTVSDADAVVLETNGTFSVVRGELDGFSLGGVRGDPEGRLLGREGRGSDRPAT